MNQRLILATSLAIALGTVAAPLAAAAQDASAPMRPIFRARAIATSTGQRLGAPRTGSASSTLLRRYHGIQVRAEAASGTRARFLRSGAATGTPQRLARQGNLLQRAQERAATEIDHRVQTLQAFAARMSNTHLSDANKSSIQATLQSQISAMLALKGKIASSTSSSTMSTDLQSIAKSYRVFALVVPQAAITAAADRVSQIVSQMQEFSGKLSSRVSAVNGNTSILSAALADFNAKVADAATQAQAAVNEVQALQPDNGNQTTFQSNRAALKDARTKLQAAQQDLVTARKDAGTIVETLKAAGSTGTQATTTASTTTS